MHGGPALDEYGVRRFRRRPGPGAGKRKYGNRHEIRDGHIRRRTKRMRLFHFRLLHRAYGRERSNPCECLRTAHRTLFGRRGTRKSAGCQHRSGKVRDRGDSGQIHDPVRTDSRGKGHRFLLLHYGRKRQCHQAPCNRRRDLLRHNGRQSGGFHLRPEDRPAGKQMGVLRIQRQDRRRTSLQYGLHRSDRMVLGGRRL